MRAIVQRVTQASVTVDGEMISSIGRGLCVLLGISRDDTPKEVDYVVRKILNVRIFDEDGQRWKRSVKDEQLEILCVSQFTLYSIFKGNKLDFHCAMGGEESEKLYNHFLQQMKSAYKPELIKDGKFRAYMQVNIQNDGPVTIDIESPPQQQQQQKQKNDKVGKVSATNASSKEKDRNDPIDSLVNDVGDKL